MHTGIVTTTKEIVYK